MHFLDDDNLMHPAFWDLVASGALRPGWFYTFDQQRDAAGSVLTGGQPTIGHIDTAMFLAPTALLWGGRHRLRFRDVHVADGVFAAKAVDEWRARWAYFPSVRAYYNRLTYAGQEDS